MEKVNHPSYYGGKDDPFEVRKVLNAWKLEWKLSNVIKYCARAGKKDPATEIQDLEKAQFYLTDRINELKSEYGESSTLPSNSTASGQFHGL